MLLGPVCSDVLRVNSAGTTAVTTLSGSVGGDFNGGGAFAVGESVEVGGSNVAVTSGTATCSERVDIWEGLRESIVGIGVGFGAGRV